MVKEKQAASSSSAQAAKYNYNYNTTSTRIVKMTICGFSYLVGIILAKLKLFAVNFEHEQNN